MAKRRTGLAAKRRKQKSPKKSKKRMAARKVRNAKNRISGGKRTKK